MTENNVVRLDDSNLEQVTGGAELKVSIVGQPIETCDDFICLWCGCSKEPGKSGHHCEPQGGLTYPDISWFDYICHWCAKESACPKAHRPAGVCLPRN